MRKVLIGLIVGLLIGTAGTAFASSDYIQAKFSHFNLKVNGTEVELDNQPLVVEGTTYWPIRELSEYIGFDIDYEGSTRTIVVETLIETNGINDIIDEVDVVENNEKELPKEGDVLPTIENDEYTTLRAINTRLETAARALQTVEMSLYYDITEELRDRLLNDKALIEAEIADLEARKALLESQQ